MYKTCYTYNIMNTFHMYFKNSQFIMAKNFTNFNLNSDSVTVEQWYKRSNCRA